LAALDALTGLKESDVGITPTATYSYDGAAWVQHPGSAAGAVYKEADLAALNALGAVATASLGRANDTNTWYVYDGAAWEEISAASGDRWFPSTYATDAADLATKVGHLPGDMAVLPNGDVYAYDSATGNWQLVTDPPEVPQFWDPTAGTFPATQNDGQPVEANDCFYAIAAATIDGRDVRVGDKVTAMKETPSTATWGGGLEWTLQVSSQPPEEASIIEVLNGTGADKYVRPDFMDVRMKGYERVQDILIEDVVDATSAAPTAGLVHAGLWLVEIGGNADASFTGIGGTALIPGDMLSYSTISSQWSFVAPATTLFTDTPSIGHVIRRADSDEFWFRPNEVYNLTDLQRQKFSIVFTQEALAPEPDATRYTLWERPVSGLLYRYNGANWVEI